MKKRLKKWVKVTIIVLFLLFYIYIIIGWFTRKEIIITETKNYKCIGFKVMQICHGDDYDVK